MHKGCLMGSVMCLGRPLVYGRRLFARDYWVWGLASYIYTTPAFPRALVSRNFHRGRLDPNFSVQGRRTTPDPRSESSCLQDPYCTRYHGEHKNPVLSGQIGLVVPPTLVRFPRG